MPIHNRFYLVNNQISPLLLQTLGPREAIEIHLAPALAEHFSQAGKPLPSPVTGQALFDTGASVSAVDAQAIGALGLNPVGVTSVHTPGGVVRQNLYPVRFLFPGMSALRIDFNAVIGSELQSQGIIALVGRDVLSKCLLVYNGPAGICSISI